jgi:serine/threonine protein kinase
VNPHALLPSVTVPPPADGRMQRIGRFELKQVLGRGAQATVWLAHDPRLDRDVALKRLDPAADSVALRQWLHEARAVSRLNHPNIVPLFEADQHDGVTYLVFELVSGKTLDELMRPRVPMPARDAVRLMLGVVDALAAAHGQGIVHRDLKPSNVLVGGDGRARVMDFGIAARIDAGADGLIVGTPGYMSPEAARGEAQATTMDVFADGAVLGELLCGRRLLQEPDPQRWLRRVQCEPLELPLQPHLDDSLRAIVHRAVARDPAHRFDSAQVLRDTLANWLQPAPQAGAPGDAAGHGTLEFLLRRMRHRSDFPALSESVMRIQRVASSDSESLASLCAEILKDVALTNKLLRVVNTAHFGPSSGAGISTISRAVSLVGFAGIRNMAMSLVWLEHMQDRSHAVRLQHEFLRALMAGTLASELAASTSESEHAFVASMFQGLGRLLAEFYLPEEALQIREQLNVDGTVATASRREAVAAQVLGLSYEALGVGVARTWGLPEALLHCMRAAPAEPPSRPAAGGERQHWLGCAANAMTDALLEGEDEGAERRLRNAAKKHARVLGLALNDMQGAVARARERMGVVAHALSLHVAPASPTHRLLLGTQESTQRLDPSPTPHAVQATIRAERPPIAGHDSVALAAPQASAAEQLAAGMHDITDAMVADDFKLDEVLRMVLETMYRGLRFQRVVFCLRDARADALTGRFGLGTHSAAVAQVFRVPLRAAQSARADLFAAVCRKGADTLIPDARAIAIATRLPAWYRQHVNAPAFMLLPMMLKDAPLALIYADMAESCRMDIDEKVLALLRTLRNQALMAFKQAA